MAQSDTHARGDETDVLAHLDTTAMSGLYWYLGLLACIGGFLFGYDTGVSNGAEGPMAEELGLSLLQLGVVISSLIFAAAVGALVGGKISDAIGRRTTIIVLAVMFFVGVLIVVFSPGFTLLVTGRIILGLAVGGASTVVPVYLA